MNLSRLTRRDDFLGLLLPGQSNRITFHPQEVLGLGGEVILLRDLPSLDQD